MAETERLKEPKFEGQRTEVGEVSWDGAPASSPIQPAMGLGVLCKSSH